MASPGHAAFLTLCTVLSLDLRGGRGIRYLLSIDECDGQAQVGDCLDMGQPPAPGLLVTNRTAALARQRRVSWNRWDGLQTDELRRDESRRPVSPLN